jgi:LEA14-like dessication related protein
MFRYFLVLFLILPLGACVGLPTDFSQLQEPRVTLTGLALADADLWAPSFLLRLAVDNPNDLDLQLAGADADLRLNGESVARGVSRSPLTLVKRGTSELTVQATGQTLRIAQHTLSLQARDTLDYEITGHVQVVNWLGGLGRIPFRFKDTIRRDELLRAVEGAVR